MTRPVAKMMLIAFVIGALFDSICSACPFCPTAATTLREDLNAMDVVAMGRLVGTQKNDDGVQIGRFAIAKILKGKSVLGDSQVVSTIYFGEPRKNALFLLHGSDPPKLNWSIPMALSDEGESYITKLMAMPKSAPNRLAFFQEYLESDDEMIARDAFDEFARASYQEVIDHKSKMDHDQLIEWIKSRDVPASRRRLYLTMLGVCGTPDDLPLLESMLKSSDRRQKAGLDAMIACYLTLRGADGLPLIENTFIKNTKAEYADTYSAIMAIRFHGNQSDVIPRERLMASLRLMLERPPLADLVIPDLAKWEDWSVVDKLVDLFNKADEKSSWVRLPVVNYLQVCPLPAAKQRIKELEKLDPETVKRARSIFPASAAGTASGT